MLSGWSDMCSASPLAGGAKTPFGALMPEAEHEADDVFQYDVGEIEEGRGRKHHHEHAARRDHRLLARRPGDLGAFGTHFLQKLDRVFHIAILRAARRSAERP